MRSRAQVLIDIGELSCGCSDHALETLAKAISDEGGDAHDIWEPHHSPFVSRLIELFSSRGLLRIDAVKEELAQWQAGAHFEPHIHGIVRPDGMMLRWTKDELALVRLYLTSLQQSAFLLDDWGLLVDYLVHKYLPLNDLRTEAEWLATRSAMMGKVQANLAGTVLSATAADTLITAMPLTIGGAQAAFNFGGTMDAVMQFGKLHCSELIVDLSNGLRSRIKKTILEHQFAVLERDPLATPQLLQQKLFDNFGQTNRDWRRIAITEAGEMANQGMIATMSPGSRVRRIEQYKGACAFCKKIDKTVLTVVSPETPKKDGKTQVWVGKNNIGRSAAPRKRIGDILVEREAHERWWVPAGTVHPHCRGTWVAMPESAPTDNPDFQAWLDQHFHKIATN